MTYLACYQTHTILDILRGDAKRDLNLWFGNLLGLAAKDSLGSRVSSILSLTFICSTTRLFNGVELSLEIMRLLDLTNLFPYYVLASPLKPNFRNSS